MERAFVLEVSVLELIDLQKRYAGRQVLAGASLAVGNGEAVALVGANGSGKTTLLRCAVGLHHLDAGRVLVDGLDITRESRVARARMSYLPQRPEFPLTLTVREILSVAADLRGLPSAAVDREMSLCGLTPLAARTVSKLSGGERQRVALATLLMPDVALYLIDEPTANLDEDGTELVINRVAALRDRGCAILFTSHVGSDVDRLATRTVVLRGGRVESRSVMGEEDGHVVGGSARGAGGVRNGVVGRMRGAREWPRAVAARPR